MHPAKFCITLFAFTTLALQHALALRTKKNATVPMELQKYDRAIAPYVAQARATYPDAKKRFLAGLPRGYTFAVWLRLYEKDKQNRIIYFEDCFVSVERIAGGRFYGRLENKPTMVHGHSLGEKVSGEESEIRNWMIEHPDGSEEGNVVGKFLEKHYMPK
jgi:uncharacterized protein YegJ (DUF2314 family)